MGRPGAPFGGPHILFTDPVDSKVHLPGAISTWEYEGVHVGMGTGHTWITLGRLGQLSFVLSSRQRFCITPA